MKPVGIFLIIFSLMIPFRVYGLSDQEYEILKENSQEFSDADANLAKVWKQVKNSLSEQDAKSLLIAQREWIKHGWDENANKLMKTQNISRTKAYIEAINDRIKYLNNYHPKNEESMASLFKNTPSSSDTITVEAEGMGRTRQEALQAAWKEVVQKGVGLFMTSNTKAVDDEIVENIVEHSRGNIDSFKIIKENQDNGIYYITLSADIKSDILKEPAKFTKSKIISFDGRNLAAKQASKENEKSTAAKLIKEIPNIINLDPLIKYEVNLGEVIYKGDKYYVLNSVVKIDLNNFLIQAKELHKYLSQIALSKYNMPFAEYLAKPAMQMLKTDKYDFSVFRDDSIRSIKMKRKPLTKADMGQHLGFYWNGSREEESICIYENIRGAICYKMEPQIYNKLIDMINKKRKYKIELIAEIGGGENYFSTDTFIEYPFSANWIVPDFGYMNGQACVLQAQVVLDMSKEELLNTTEINGKYELKPY